MVGVLHAGVVPPIQNDGNLAHAAGDAVEACFGSGSVWYPATVLSTLDREGMPMIVVRYDEDDGEEELEPCFARKIT